MDETAAAACSSSGGAAATAATTAATATAAAATEEEDDAVLLYYKYTPLAGREAGVRDWYEALCARLRLRGRIRVAADGVNVTVGGARASVDAHVEAVKRDPVLRGDDIDFKIAAAPPGAHGRGGGGGGGDAGGGGSGGFTGGGGGSSGAGVLAETGFEALRVSVCRELVSLGAAAAGRADPFKHGGAHLSPEEFHAALLEASSAAAAAASSSGGKGDAAKPGVVLVDARNGYESAIGRFDPPPGVELLEPRTRSFAELPAWLDANEARLAGRRVLMVRALFAVMMGCGRGAGGDGVQKKPLASQPRLSHTHTYTSTVLHRRRALRARDGAAARARPRLCRRGPTARRRAALPRGVRRRRPLRGAPLRVRPARQHGRR